MEVAILQVLYLESSSLVSAAKLLRLSNLKIELPTASSPIAADKGGAFPSCVPVKPVSFIRFSG